jgi:hypothetical protein
VKDMSQQNVTVEDSNSVLRSKKLPIDNLEEISEYQEASKNFTMLVQELEIPITAFDRDTLISEVRGYLKGQFEALKFEVNGFYRILEVEREPHFVIDLLIEIPELTRKNKFQVLPILGNLMKKHHHLLFDFRITKKRTDAEFSPI